MIVKKELSTAYFEHDFYVPIVEVKRLQERKHKIKKQQISMEIMEIAAAVEMGQSDHEGFPTLPTTITVSGFPDTADEELLKMYFESPDSGGCEGAVEQNLIVTKGIAHVKFHSPDSKHAQSGNSLYTYMCLTCFIIQLQLKLSPNLEVILSVAHPYVSDTMTRVRDTRVTGSDSTSFPQEHNSFLYSSILGEPYR